MLKNIKETANIIEEPRKKDIQSNCSTYKAQMHFFVTIGLILVMETSEYCGVTGMCE